MRYVGRHVAGDASALERTLCGESWPPGSLAFDRVTAEYLADPCMYCVAALADRRRASDMSGCAARQAEIVGRKATKLPQRARRKR